MIRLLAGLTGAFLLTGTAEAAVTFTSTPFDNAAAYAGAASDAIGNRKQVLVDDFDHPVAAGYSFTFRDGAQIEQGSVYGFAAAPAGDATGYAVVPTDAYAYLLSSTPLQSASVYIGSIDPYNYVAFLDNGSLVATFGGSDLVQDADGDQSSGATNRLFDFDFGNDHVDEIVFGSTGNSFEFDNIAVSAVPEPSMWILMLVGVGVLGAALRGVRRRPDQTAAVATASN